MPFPGRSTAGRSIPSQKFERDDGVVTRYAYPMPLTLGLIAARTGIDVEFGDDLVSATIEIVGVTTRDGHTICGTYTVPIRAATSALDRRALADALTASNSDAIGATEIAGLVRTDVEASLRYTADAHDAAWMLSQDGRRTTCQSLDNAVDSVAFRYGMQLDGASRWGVRSPTLDADRLRAAERVRVDAEAADRLRHLRHAATVARDVFAQGDGLPANFLESVAEADRPAALAATIARGAGKGVAPLYLVAGRSLVVIDPASPTARVVCTANDAVGALRSVRALHHGAKNLLALGGQRGVELIDLAKTSEAAPSAGRAVFVDDSQSSSLGFNDVAIDPSTGHLVATHSQAGLVTWNFKVAGDADATHGAAERRSPNLTGAGGLSTLGDGDQLAFSAGPRVYVVSAGEPREIFYAVDADVVAILPERGRSHVVTEDGAYVTLERDAAGQWRPGGRTATGGPVSAATALPWLSGVRLLLAREDGGLDCVGVDDTVVTRYASRHVGLRAIATSATHVAALTADRQRVVFWSAMDGRAPVGEVHVSAMVGNRVAGIEFGNAEMGAELST